MDGERIASGPIPRYSPWPLRKHIEYIERVSSNIPVFLEWRR
jgi:hypothetical protein